MYTDNTRYPTLRAVLSEELDHYDDHSFEDYVSQVWPDATAEELEVNFKAIGRTLGRGLRQAGQVVVRALPGVINGAVQGASTGAMLGPKGMLAGAAIGAIGGGIASATARRPQQAQRQNVQRRQAQRMPPQQPPRAQPQPRPVPPRIQLPPGAAAPIMTRPAPPRQAPPRLAPPRRAPQRTMQRAAYRPTFRRRVSRRPMPSNASQALLQLLSRPEVINALLSLTMGQIGRRQIPVGNTFVSPQRIAALINSEDFAPEEGSFEAEEFAISDDAILEEIFSTPAEDHPFAYAVGAGESANDDLNYDDFDFDFEDEFEDHADNWEHEADHGAEDASIHSQFEHANGDYAYAGWDGEDSLEDNWDQAHLEDDVDLEWDNADPASGVEEADPFEAHNAEMWEPAR